MAKLLSVKKVNQSGYSVSGRIYFEAHFDAEPTPAEIEQAQNQAGYHPAGYGGPWGASTKQVEGVYITSFHCAASCD